MEGVGAICALNIDYILYHFRRGWLRRGSATKNWNRWKFCLWSFCKVVYINYAILYFFIAKLLYDSLSVFLKSCFSNFSASNKDNILGFVWWFFLLKVIYQKTRLRTIKMLEIVQLTLIHIFLGQCVNTLL